MCSSYELFLQPSSLYSLVLAPSPFPATLVLIIVIITIIIVVVVVIFVFLSSQKPTRIVRCEAPLRPTYTAVVSVLS